MESPSSAIEASDAVKGMEFFFCKPQGFESGVFVEEGVQIAFIFPGEAVRCAEKEPSEVKAMRFMHGNFFSLLQDHWVNKSKDMEFIGDELSVREEVADEGAIRVTEIEGDSFDVFSAGDMKERFFEAIFLLRSDEFKRFFVFEVDDQCGEGNAVLSSRLKRVFVDANHFRPGVEISPSPTLQLIVEGFIQES